MERKMNVPSLEPEGAATATAEPSIPPVMKAAVFCSKGSSSILQVQADFPVPERKGKDLLVKVAASSVNPIDFKVRNIGFPLGMRSRYPKVTGSDGAGVVVSVSPYSKFKPGDLVYFYINPIAKHGTAAEYTLVPEDHAALIPLQHIDVFSAASIPLVACTAFQALHKSMPLNGKRVFIQAGSGGVGTAAIQMAKSQGAFVVTTCSSGSMDLCRQLGADVCCDYRSQRFEEVARGHAPDGYDVVVSSVGGWDYDKRNLQLTKKGGHFCYIFRLVTTPSEWLIGLWTKILFLTGRLGASTVLVARGKAEMGLEQASRMIEAGNLRPVVSKLYDGLEHTAEAQEVVERGSGVRGKIVVKHYESMEALMQGGLAPYGGNG